MLYIISFIFGVALGCFMVWFKRRKIDYPGELVLTKDNEIYLAVDENFKEKVRYAGYITLKIHRV